VDGGIARQRGVRERLVDRGAGLLTLEVDAIRIEARRMAVTLSP